MTKVSGFLATRHLVTLCVCVRLCVYFCIVHVRSVHAYAMLCYAIAHNVSEIVMVNLYAVFAFERHNFFHTIYLLLSPHAENTTQGTNVELCRCICVSDDVYLRRNFIQVRNAKCSVFRHHSHVIIISSNELLPIARSNDVANLCCAIRLPAKK